MHWLLSFVLVACTVQSDSPPAIVARMWAQYAQFLIRHDVDALADLYTVDARLMEPNADDFVGREVIRLRLKIAFAQRVRTIDTRITPREVVGFNGLIYDQGDYIETLAPLGDSRRATDVYGRYVALWAEQTDGTWKLARMMVSAKKQPRP